MASAEQCNRCVKYKHSVLAVANAAAAPLSAVYVGVLDALRKKIHNNPRQAERTA